MNWKSEPTRGRRGRRRLRESGRLDMPVTGMEAEFNVVLDGVEIDPRAYWKDPTAFIDVPLLRWEQRTGHHVRLKAYSAHYNISFELKRHEQDAHRNIQKLALLLTYILPVPVAVIGTNRRSTGVGVRPREERIE